MMMNTAFIQDGNKTWHCFSIFYPQNEWQHILPLLNTYMMSKPDIYQYMFFFSHERGEHIRVIISSYTKDAVALQEAVHQALSEVVERYPSRATILVDCDKELWANHAANTVERNGFEFSYYKSYNFPYNMFLNLTTLLIVRLLENDYSEESRTSVALYLYTQLCHSMQMASLQNFLHSLSIPDCTENVEEEMQLISSYWESNPQEEFSSDIAIFHFWNKEKECIYSIMGVAAGFNALTYNIREQLDITSKSYSYALSLLKAWSIHMTK